MPDAFQERSPAKVSVPGLLPGEIVAPLPVETLPAIVPEPASVCVAGTTYWPTAETSNTAPASAVTRLDASIEAPAASLRVPAVAAVGPA